LLIERLEDHVVGTVGGVAAPPHRTLAEMMGVAAEATLRDPPILRPGERKPHVLQLEDDLGSVVAHDLDRVLVTQVVAPLHGVEGVPLRVILLEVPQRRPDPALGRTRVRTRRVELRQNRGLDAATGQVQRRHQSGAAAADHDGAECMHVTHGKDACTLSGVNWNVTMMYAPMPSRATYTRKMTDFTATAHPGLGT